MTNSALARTADHRSIRLLPLPEIQALFGGISRANVYSRIDRGLLPRPVKIGKVITFPSNETEEILAAHVAGKSETDIAALVQNLHQNRTRN